MCSWKEQVNLPAQRPPSKLPFARVTFIRVAASQLNWGRGFPGIVGSVSCSCLGEHFLVVVRTWTMWQLRSHARPPRRRLPAPALEMLGADLCPAILPLGASVPGGAQRIALSLAARGVALKKPSATQQKVTLRRGAPVAEPQGQRPSCLRQAPPQRPSPLCALMIIVLLFCAASIREGSRGGLSRT